MGKLTLFHSLAVSCSSGNIGMNDFREITSAHVTNNNYISLG